MKMELATRSRRRAPPTIIFWARLINLEFAAAFILSIETLDCRIPFRNIAHRNEPKAARLAGFAISDQFDFRNGAERLKEFPQCAFCHVKGKISDVKYLVTEMVCWAAGGPQKYTGRSMYESHKDMKIIGGEWDAFMDDFQQTLDKFGVPAQEQAELKAIVESTRADIVVEPGAAATS